MPERVKAIESLARDVIEEAYSQNRQQIAPPINLQKILDYNGLCLKIATFKDPRILGAIDKKEKIIYVVPEQPYKRKVFTIAHELGHFFLHNEIEAEFFFREDAIRPESNSDNKETEANWFASSLLMPDFLVKRFWPQFNTSAMISDLFRVSNSAANFRIKNLKL